ncbi:MAG: preprotein translocase subunit SecG [Tepidisphaeraceae bacterium]
MTFLYYSLLTLFLILSLFMILLVLIQKGRGGGLSAAFGGGGGGNTAFGAKTGDVLTWATSIVFGVFVALAIGLNLLANRIHAQNTQLIAPTTQVAPAATDDLAMPPASTPPASTQPASTQPTTESPAATGTPAAPAPAASQPAK